MITIEGQSPKEKGEKCILERGEFLLEYNAIAVGSTKVISHWRLVSVTNKETGEKYDVYKDRSRQQDNENEGPWHRDTKEMFHKMHEGSQVEYCIKDEDNELKIADLYIPDANVVIEFQNSPLSESTVIDRNTHYVRAGNKIGWVLSPDRSKISARNSIELPLPDAEERCLACDYSRVSSLMNVEHLQEEDVPVFLDVGDSKYYLLLLLGTYLYDAKSYKHQLMFIQVLKEKVVDIVREGDIYNKYIDKISSFIFNKVPALPDCSALIEKINNFEARTDFKIRYELAESAEQKAAAITFWQKNKKGEVDEKLLKIGKELEDEITKILYIYKRAVDTAVYKSGIPPWVKRHVDLKELDRNKYALEQALAYINQAVEEIRAKIDSYFITEPKFQRTIKIIRKDSRGHRYTDYVPDYSVNRFGETSL